MPKENLALQTISVDFDTIYFSYVLTKFWDLPSGQGVCLFFEDTSGRIVSSLVQLDDQNCLVDINNKFIISYYDNTCAYGFI